MSEPTGCAGGCLRTDMYCDRCDLLVGLPGLRVIKVHDETRRLVVTVESPPTAQGCRVCGVIASSHGRRTVRLVDAPWFSRPVRVVWRKRTWVCEEPACPGGVFTEQHDQVARARGLLTVRLSAAIEADERHVEVFVAWQCAQQLRRVDHQPDPATGRRLAEQIVASFATCPIPEVARLGRTLKKWRREFLANFDTTGAPNGGTEAVNGLIELHRRVARGLRNRDNYQLQMLLIGDGLTSPHLR